MSATWAGASVPKRRSPIALFGGDASCLLYSDPELGGDGKVRIDPDKPQAKWKWIASTIAQAAAYTIPASRTVKSTLTIAPAGSAQQGDFEAFSILSRFADSSNAHGRVAIRPRVRTPTCDRWLSNVVISHTLLTGTSQLPGQLLQGIYCLPKTSWEFEIRNLESSALTADLALFGRQFQNCSPAATQELRRRAEHLQWFHPYWIGPEDPAEPLFSEPEITLTAGRSIKLTYPVPSDSDFLAFGMLDDSLPAGGAEPNLFAQISENASGQGLVDLSGQPGAGIASTTGLGIQWRDFLAIPTLTAATGFQRSVVNAYSMAPNLGGFTHLIPRGSQLTIRFTNADASSSATLRTALFGLRVYGRPPAGWGYSADDQSRRERVAQGEEFLRRMGLESAFAGGGVA